MLIIELLISEAYEHVPPHTFCLEARALVDDSDGSEALKAAIKAKIKQAAAGTSTLPERPGHDKRLSDGERAASSARSVSRCTEGGQSNWL